MISVEFLCNINYMTDFNLAAYKSLYLKTAREHIANLRINLELLKADPADKKVIYEVFRLFHSLKSQNYFMGFEKTAHLCKIFENFFRAINESKKTFNPQISPVILKTVADLEHSLNEIDKNNNEIDLTPNIINLENGLSQL